MSFVRRFFGIFIIIAALVGVAVGVGCAVVGNQVMDQVAVGVNDTLTLVNQNLQPVEDALVLVQESMRDVNQGVDSIHQTTLTLANILTTTRPLLSQVSLMTGQDVPNSIEAVQTAIPSLTSVAGTIDNTLTALSQFQINQSILGFNLAFDLGVDYNPEVAFADSVQQIGDSFEGLPERLKAVAGEIDVANGNLERIGGDIKAVSASIKDLQGQMEQFPGLLDQYIQEIGVIKANLTASQTAILAQFDTVKLAITIVGAWFALTQFAPLYVGWGLLRGQSAFEDNDEEEIKPE